MTLTFPSGPGARPRREVEPIAALMERRTGVTHRLPLTETWITAGRSREAHVRIADPFVSRTQCAMERLADGLRVHDRGSHNGTFIDGDPAEGRVLGPGATLAFTEDRTTGLVALTARMLEALPDVVLLVGARAHASAAAVLALAGSASNVAILAPAGAMPVRLAQIVHRISTPPRRSIQVLTSLPRSLETQRDVVESARNGTLVLALEDGSPRLHPMTLAMLLDPRRAIRWIVTAPRTDTAVDVIGAEAFAAMAVLTLSTLRDRGEDLPRLFDHCLRLLRSRLRLDAGFTESNAEVLRAHAWDGGIEEMWRVAEAVHALDDAGTIRAAALALGVPRSTLHGWLRAMGLSLPL